jgi:hypothetical protein
MKKKKEIKKVESMKWREAVEFLIRFASIETPEELRLGDRLNLIDDLRRYLDVEGEGRLAREIAEAQEKPEKLMPAIEVVRKFAAAAADKKLAETTREGGTTIIFDGGRLDDERGAISLDGSLRDVMLGTVVSDLDDAQSWQICRCLECKKIFLASRKGQIYCSHRCANAVAVRMKRTRDERTGKAEPREAKER